MLAQILRMRFEQRFELVPHFKAVIVEEDRPLGQYVLRVLERIARLRRRLLREVDRTYRGALHRPGLRRWLLGRGSRRTGLALFHTDRGLVARGLAGTTGKNSHRKNNPQLIACHRRSLGSHFHSPRQSVTVDTVPRRARVHRHHLSHAGGVHRRARSIARAHPCH